MKRIILLFVMVLAGISAVAQNSASLKMNLEKNRVYRFNSTSEQTIIQTVNGNSQTVESKSVYALSIKMIDATPDFMITEVHIDTMKTSTNTMGKTSVMSSANEGNIKSTEATDVVSCIMNRLSKNALYIKMDYAGKPLEIVNLQMLSDAILKDTSSITLTGPTAPAIKKQVADIISANTLKTVVELFTFHLPARQVSSGDTWNVAVRTTSGGMALDISTNYHLDGLKENIADITSESEIKAAANAEPIVQGGAKITYDDMKGLSKSTLKIDLLTGLLIEEKAKSHIAGNLGVSAPGMSMQIPMDMSSESKVTAIK
jgi:hypothetical protein